MSRTDPRVIPCGVALVRRGRQFLIAQRKKNDTFAFFWEFPGGKKDEGESFEDCVAREVMEETGVEIKVHEKFAEIRRTYHDRTIWLNFFICSYISGEPCAIDCEKVQWADIEELKNFKFPPANEEVIAKLTKLVGP